MTEDFLRILGVSPLMGRDFTAADNTPGAEKVALIGYGIWQRDFGGAADIVGKGVRINGKPRDHHRRDAARVRVPDQRGDLDSALQRVPAAAAQRSGGDQPRRARPAEGRRVARPGERRGRPRSPGGSRRRIPETNKQFNTGQVQPLIETFTPRPLRGTLWTMLGFCVGVLLIACVNVMNMQFARATLRAKELAVRSSLGATPPAADPPDADREPAPRRHRRRRRHRAGLRVDRLAVGHGAQSREPAAVVDHVRHRRAGAGCSRSLRDARRAVFSGLLPALMSSRTNAVEVLRDGGRGNTSRSVDLVTRGLVVFQIVVTCVLLIGSLLQLRSIINQQTIDYGYDTAG